MADKNTIEIIFAGVDNFSDVAGKIGGELEGFGGNLKNISAPFADLAEKALLAEAALAAMAGTGLAFAYAKSVELESSMAGLNKVMGDELPGTVARLSSAAEAMSDKYGVATTQVIESMSGWKQAGFSAQEAALLAENTVKAVIAGDIDMASATEKMVAALKGFNLEASDSTRLIDIVNEVSNKYATNFGELAIAMGDISPVAKQMGFTMEETAGLVTPVIEVFRSGSESATALKTGLLKLIDDSAPVKDSLAALGVAQTDVNGKLRSGKEIMFDVAKAFQTADESQKLFLTKELVGIEQSARMVQVFDNLAKSTEITATAMNAAGSASAETAVRLATSEVAINRFVQGFTNLAAAIGAEMNKSLTSVISGGTDIESALKNMVKGDTFDPLFSAVNSAAEKLAALLRSIAANLPQAMEGVDFTPLISSAENIGVKLGSIFDIDLSTPEGLRGAIQGVIDGISSLQNVVAGIIESLGPFFDLVKSGAAIFASMDEGTAEMAGNFLGIAGQVNEAAGAISEVGGAIKSAADMIPSLKENYQSLITVFPALGTAVTGLSGTLSGLGTALGTVLTGPAGLVVMAAVAGAAAGSLINMSPAVKGAAESVLGWVDSLANFSGTSGQAGQAADDFQLKIQKEVMEIRAAKKATDEVKASLDALPEKTDIEVGMSVDEFKKNADMVGETASQMFADLETEVVKIRMEIDQAQARGELDKVAELTADLAQIQGVLELDTSKVRPQFEEVGRYADGTPILMAVEISPKSAEDTQKKLKDLVPAEKQLEIQAKIDISNIEAATDRFDSMQETFREKLKFQAELDIAKVEASGKVLMAVSDNVGAAFQASSSAVSDLITTMAGIDTTQSFAAQKQYQDMLDQVKVENQLRQEALDIQKQLITSQISLNQEKAKQISSGQGIKMEVAAPGLPAHLEVVWYDILEALQVRVNEEGGAMLLGL